MQVIVGSRGSKLALTQTQWVIDIIKKHHPEVDFQIKVIKTKGDELQNIALDKIGSKGVFVEEIEEQLLRDEIQIAVHSMKDMSTSTPDNLKFSYVPKREDYRDVLVLDKKYKAIDELPMGAKIGTGSKRRKYQLLDFRPNLEIVPIRGNIDTRMKKVYSENLDGVVLAAAGIKRLGLENTSEYTIVYLDEDIVMPAPAQGILALEIRRDKPEIEELLKCIEDKESEIQAKAERAFLKGVNGGCHLPIGALCTIDGDIIKLKGLLGNEEGTVIIKKSVEGDINNPEEVGFKLAESVLKEIR